MSTTIEEDYIENLSNEISDWCETLIGQGRLEFKQSECKEKFIVVMEGKVIKACELLCTKGKILQDPSSRRIIIYKIDAGFIAKTEQKSAEKATVPALAPAKKAPSFKAEKTIEGVLKPVTESKKNKATEQAGTSNKKQKFSDVTGVKKISSYFAAQPKASAASQAKKSNDEDGENTEPHASSANTSVSSQATQNSHASQASHASHTTLAGSGTTKTASAPAPKPMFKITIEEFSPFKPEPEYTEQESSEGAINEDLIAQVCKLIVAETERRQAADEAESMLVVELLGQLGQLGEGANEEELRAVLQRLEGQNKIMVDVDTIYVV